MDKKWCVVVSDRVNFGEAKLTSVYGPYTQKEAAEAEQELSESLYPDYSADSMIMSAREEELT